MPNTTNIDLDALQALAEKAGPICTDLLGDRYFGGDYSCAQLTVDQDRFVYAANPQTILSLIARIRELESRADAGAQPMTDEDISELLTACCDDNNNFDAISFARAIEQQCRRVDTSAETWVSVGDRLPEVGEEVLLYRPLAHETNDPPMHIARYIGFPRVSPQGVEHTFDCWCHPTHWQPLIAPGGNEGKDTQVKETAIPLTTADAKEREDHIEAERGMVGEQATCRVDYLRANFTPFYLLANARRIASAEYRRKPNWVLAMDLFAVGSNSAHAICREAGIDPDAYEVKPATPGGKE